jgi:hypothetical protein
MENKGQLRALLQYLKILLSRPFGDENVRKSLHHTVKIKLSL